MCTFLSSLILNLASFTYLFIKFNLKFLTFYNLRLFHFKILSKQIKKIKKIKKNEKNWDLIVLFLMTIIWDKDLKSIFFAHKHTWNYEHPVEYDWLNIEASQQASGSVIE